VVVGLCIPQAVAQILDSIGPHLETAVGVLALPLQLGTLVLFWRLLYPEWSPYRRNASTFDGIDSPAPDRPTIGDTFARGTTLAVLSWIAFAPIVLLIHSIVNAVFTLLDLTIETHPITHLVGGAASRQLLFLTEVCFGAPLREEILFRGILLPWLIGGYTRGCSSRAAPARLHRATRPVIVLAIAGLFAWFTSLRSDGHRIYPAVIFAATLYLGLGIIWVGVRRGKRHWRGIYSSAAFFAVVHTPVWPSPIPLFVLGLGLGWLAVRTRGVLVPVLVHGLFNAVSAVYVLRGAM